LSPDSRRLGWTTLEFEATRGSSRACIARLRALLPCGARLLRFGGSWTGLRGTPAPLAAPGRPPSPRLLLPKCTTLSLNSGPQARARARKRQALDHASRAFEIDRLIPKPGNPSRGGFSGSQRWCESTEGLHSQDPLATGRDGLPVGV
jgi:hypothetical protein